MNIFQRASLLFKNPKNTEGRRQPVYEKIAIDDIPPASALLFYNGNKVTERAGYRLFKHHYWPPAFHAAFYIGERLFLNVGKFKTVEDLTTELRSSRRIDVVIYKVLNQFQRQEMSREATLGTSKHRIGLTLPDYAVTDYLRFLFRGLPTSKKQFCSENVAETFGLSKAHGNDTGQTWADRVDTNGGIRISDGLPVDCAPWDVLEGALNGMGGAEIRTLHVGHDYPYRSS